MKAFQLSLAEFQVSSEQYYQRKSRNKRLAAPVQEFLLPEQLALTLDALLDGIPEVEWTEKSLTTLRDAMISRSLEIIRNKKANTDSFAEELAWLFSDSDEDHPFSIQQCCVSAGLSIDDLRLGIDYALDEEKRMILRLIDNGRYNTKKRKSRSL